MYTLYIVHECYVVLYMGCAKPQRRIDVETHVQYVSASFKGTFVLISILAKVIYNH